MVNPYLVETSFFLFNLLNLLLKKWRLSVGHRSYFHARKSYLKLIKLFRFNQIIIGHFSQVRIECLGRHG